MSGMLLAEQHLQFSKSLKGGCTGSSEPTFGADLRCLSLFSECFYYLKRVPIWKVLLARSVIMN